MASPQKENGFTPIANDLMDAFCKTRITSQARQVLDVIIRKTYGFNKKQDAISLSQFCLFTGLKKNNICRAITLLIEHNLIFKQGNDIANIYRFNKDFQQWKPFTKRGTYSNKGKAIPQQGNKRSPTRDIQKTVSKDNITKDISEHSSQVQNLFKFFYENINPNINFANKTDRQAAEWLIGKYGYEKVLAAAEFAFSVQNQKYAPTITTPYQLKEKMAALAKFKTAKKGSKVWRTTSASQSSQLGEGIN